MTYTVTNTSSSGTGSLAAAITSGDDTIDFSNTTAGGATNFYDGSAHTITLTASLPTISHSVTITAPPVPIGDSPFVIIDANHTGPGVTINDATATGSMAVALNNLTIEHGSITNSSGELTKAGTGIFTLTGDNTYSGGTVISGGTLAANAADADEALGQAGVGVSISVSIGVLDYKGTTTTTRSFTLGGGTMEVNSGKTVILNGTTVAGGDIAGSGTFETDATAADLFSSDTAETSATITSLNSGDEFDTFTDLGTVNIQWSSSPDSTVDNLNGFTIGSGSNHSASLTIYAPDHVETGGFTSYAHLTVSPAVPGSGNYTILTNVGSSTLAFDTGSDAEIGSTGTANYMGSPSFVAGIDLEGQNATITGASGSGNQAEINNNGFVSDFSGGTPGKVIVYTYGLYKGTGFTGVTVSTMGGSVEAGDCPGAATFANLTLGSGGVSGAVFQIDDATGTAGPAPDDQGHVDGWSTIQTGDFSWTATTDAKVTVNLQTLSSTTTEGNDVAGEMDNFDKTESYSWPAVQWTGTYSGPTNAATLTAATVFDTSGFQNTFSGTFGWSLDTNTKTLYLTYTPG